MIEFLLSWWVGAPLLFFSGISLLLVSIDDRDIVSKCILAAFTAWLVGNLVAASSADAADCPQGDTITGPARAIDGDTLEMRDRAMRIRLQGVAAPELDEPGGPAATAAMRDIVADMQVQCLLDGTSTHGRCVASCYIGGLDIGWEIIRQGYARDCPKYSGFRYLAAERAAPGMALAQTYALPSYCRP